MAWISHTSIESETESESDHRLSRYTRKKLFHLLCLEKLSFLGLDGQTQTIDVIAKKHDTHLLYAYEIFFKETELDSEYRLSIYARKQLFFSLFCFEKLSFWGLDAQKVKRRCDSQET